MGEKQRNFEIATITYLGDYMIANDNNQNRQIEQLQKLLKKTQALPQVQDLSEETIEAEIEEVRNK